MGNTIGDPFDSFVKRQIETRQTALGQTTNISADNLKYYTSKTPWLRLASSIDLKTQAETEILTGVKGISVTQRLINAGVNGELITGNNLAKNFILQGGSLSVDSKGNALPKKGLNYDNELFNGAYGWGGLNEQSGGRGYVPMPGIESAQSTYYNRGALSKATIKIKCFSKAQFQLIDVLYLRPGYTLLLEFGWSTYLSSRKGEDVTLETYEGFKSEPLNYLLDPGSYPGEDEQMLPKISAERMKHSGNYEAIYGMVTHFKWSFGSDGSYNCEVRLIGMGNIIESLKLNVTDPKKKDDVPVEEDSTITITYNKTYKQFIVGKFGNYVGGLINNKTPKDKWTDRNKEWLGKVTDKLNAASSLENINEWAKVKYEEKKEQSIQVQTSNLNNNPVLANRDDTRLNKIFYDIYSIMLRFDGSKGGSWGNQGEVDNGIFLLDNTLNGEMNVDGGSKAAKSVYLKFAALLEIIEDNCNLFSKKGTPIVKFDFNYGGMDNDTNYMSIIPPGISTNPGICLVEYNKTKNDFINKGNIEATGDVAGAEDLTRYSSGHPVELPVDTPLNNKLKNGQNFAKKDNPYVGRLGNVLLNMRFIADSISKSPKDDDGAISVLSYLNTILKGINLSMGGINNFVVNFDESEGVIKIYDETPQPNLVKENPNKFTKINVFGVKKNQGSFVTNIGLDAEIPNNFATLVAIGSQASGNNLQGNSLSLSNYNRGLIDRVNPEKKDVEDKFTDKINNSSKAIHTFKDKIYYPFTNEKLFSPFEMIYIAKEMDIGSNEDKYNFTPSTCNNLTENYTSYIKLVQGILSNKQIIPSPFFLPFNLNLEMEGLSGMKLFEKFRITDDILPPSYEKDSVDIILKAINHDIDTQSWKTTIDTQSVPRHNENENVEEGSSETPKSTKQEKLEEAATADDGSAEKEKLEELIFKVPAEGGWVVRNDSGGGGDWLASRGSGLHKGIDLVSPVGSKIYAPMDGTVHGTSTGTGGMIGTKVYGTGEYEGYTAYLFYNQKNLPEGTAVKKGDVIATQLAMQDHYGPKVTDHVHVSIRTSGGTKYDPTMDSGDINWEV